MLRKNYPVFLVLVALFSASTLALTVDAKEFSTVEPLQSGAHLKLDTYKGTINIIAWERNEVEVMARIEAPDDVDAEYGAKIVAATEVEVFGDERALTIRSNYDNVPNEKSWLGLGTSKVLPYVHYEIHAPRHLNLRIKDYKSRIEVYDFEGTFDIETYKGVLSLRDLNGDIRLETYKGTGDILGISGSLDLETYKGTLTVEAGALTGQSRLDTYKGEITLIVPRSQGFNLNADISKKGVLISELGDKSIRIKNEDIRQDLNGGGPRLRVETYKGQVILKH
ncbi:MAG: hypothetical protein JXQ27_01210 [Acidobacteria bacterium]|nr:hypothetical protein [Acidobacteriota bacterium]